MYTYMLLPNKIDDLNIDKIDDQRIPQADKEFAEHMF